MKQDPKRILKSILLFGGILTVLNIAISLGLKKFHTGDDQVELMASSTIDLMYWDFIRIGVLVWALIYVTHKLNELRYWKLVFTAIGLVILSYHLFYLYEVIDYYFINKPALETQSSRIELMVGLIEQNRESPPFYAPIDHLTGWQMIYGGPTGALSFGRVVFVLLYGYLTMPFWLSAVVYFFFWKRKQKVQ